MVENEEVQGESSDLNGDAGEGSNVFNDESTTSSFPSSVKIEHMLHAWLVFNKAERAPIYDV